MKFNKQNQQNSNGIIRNYINQFYMESCCPAYMLKSIFLEEVHS
ncbi:hypothetical protein acsn021_20290 [Anaerocolumna cellulosilytica]|uniref:Uncharacterized protein n=1 Tax=Anaerocolumna cellulosilytica TaxID=433286 RepID=A0A6S6R4W9_9FIRM|nr:hypothetical protein [Anaerocolumna cellulosilytica]MBB5196418.1 hypothetical protein [Anaerocolumna cellulosilytica]BCJ94460.1 hypothetical protein acsn021_20290 [Anaerocolumna cellulosilytica]